MDVFLKRSLEILFKSLKKNQWSERNCYTLIVVTGVDSELMPEALNQRNFPWKRSIEAFLIEFLL